MKLCCANTSWEQVIPAISVLNLRGGKILLIYLRRRVALAWSIYFKEIPWLSAADGINTGEYCTPSPNQVSLQVLEWWGPKSRPTKNPRMISERLNCSLHFKTQQDYLTLALLNLLVWNINLVFQDLLKKEKKPPHQKSNRWLRKNTTPTSPPQNMHFWGAISVTYSELK